MQLFVFTNFHLDRSYLAHSSPEIKIGSGDRIDSLFFKKDWIHSFEMSCDGAYYPNVCCNCGNMRYCQPLLVSLNHYYPRIKVFQLLICLSPRSPREVSRVNFYTFPELQTDDNEIFIRFQNHPHLGWEWGCEGVIARILVFLSLHSTITSEYFYDSGVRIPWKSSHYVESI